MKFYSVLMLLLIVPFNVNAKEVVTDSIVSDVTIYSDRAKITRNADARIDKGENKIIFDNIPVNIDINSLEVSGVSKSNVRFGAISYKQVYLKDFSTEKENLISNNIQDLVDKKRLLVNEKRALSYKEEFVKNIAKHAMLRNNENIAELKLNTEEWGSAADNIYDSFSMIYKSNYDADIKIRDIDKNLMKLRRDLNQIRTNNKTVYRVSVPLESSAATDIDINISYQVYGINWNPSYDARLDTKNSELELMQFGVVRQNTGEDWENIDLTLSTARPQRGASLAGLNPMWVGIRQANIGLQKSMVASASFERMEEREVMMDEVTMSSIPSPDFYRKKANFSVAQVNNEGFVTEYKIAGLVSVPSDGTESRLMIGKFDMDNKMEIHIRPQIDLNGYLAVRSKLKSENPVLAGQVNLFRDDSFIGKSYINMLRQDEEQVIYFGVNDNIVVKIDKIKDLKEEAGVLIGDNIISRQYITEVENFNNQDFKILFEQSIPATTHDDVNVSLDKIFTSKGYDVDADNVKGLMRWEFDLKSKASKEIKLGWDIAWPKNDNITGLR